MVETDKFMKDYPLPSSDVKPFTDEVPVPTVPINGIPHTGTGINFVLIKNSPILKKGNEIQMSTF